MIKITPPPTPPTPHTITTETLHQILDDLVRSERTIPEIAAEFKLTYVAFQQLLESPEAQAELDALRVISAIRHDAAAPVRRENALARLTHIAAFNLDEISGRRAATTLLRELRTKLPAPSAPGPSFQGGPHQTASTLALDPSTHHPVPPTGLPGGLASQRQDRSASGRPAPASQSSTSPIHPSLTDVPSRLETRDSRLALPLPVPSTCLQVGAADQPLAPDSHQNRSQLPEPQGSATAPRAPAPPPPRGPQIVNFPVLPPPHLAQRAETPPANLNGARH